MLCQIKNCGKTKGIRKNLRIFFVEKRETKKFDKLLT